jgi:hypothetical protein
MNNNNDFTPGYAVYENGNVSAGDEYPTTNTDKVTM